MFYCRHSSWYAAARRVGVAAADASWNRGAYSLNVLQRSLQFLRSASQARSSSHENTEVREFKLGNSQKNILFLCAIK